MSRANASKLNKSQGDAGRMRSTTYTNYQKNIMGNGQIDQHDHSSL